MYDYQLKKKKKKSLPQNLRVGIDIFPLKYFLPSQYMI